MSFTWQGNYGWEHRLCVQSICRSAEGSWPMIEQASEQQVLMLGFIRPKEAEALKVRVAELETELQMAKDAYAGLLRVYQESRPSPSQALLDTQQSSTQLPPGA